VMVGKRPSQAGVLERNRAGRLAVLIVLVMAIAGAIGSCAAAIQGYEKGSSDGAGDLSRELHVARASASRAGR